MKNLKRIHPTEKVKLTQFLENVKRKINKDYKMKFLKLSFFIALCLTKQLEAVKIIDVIFQDANDWVPTAHIQKDEGVEGNGPDIIKMTGNFQDLEEYGVDILSSPPVLNIYDHESCRSFYERVKSWVSQIKLASLKFLFKGTYGEEEINICHEHPFHKDLSLRLHMMEGQQIPEKGKILINKLFAISEFDMLIDLTGWVPKTFLEYDLPQFNMTDSKPGMISVKYCGAAHEWRGRVLSYKKPCLPGVIGLSEPEENVKKPDTSTVTHIYKNAQASRVWGEKEKERHKKGIFVFPKKSFEEEGSQISSEDTRSMHSSVSYSARTSEGVEEDDSISFYNLVGSETLVESPFIYSDSENLFLTKTYEHQCREENSKETSESVPFFLTYTVPTPFKIIAESSDIRLIKGPAKFERGLYIFKEGYWCHLESNYNPLSRSSKYRAKKVDPDALSHGAHSIQKANLPEMAEVYKHLGEMAAFVKTHPKTLEDDANFKKYHDLIYSQGLLKTMTSIPDHLEHLIIPLLLTVRENPELNDPELWKPWKSRLVDKAWVYDPIPKNVAWKSMADGGQSQANHTGKFFDFLVDLSNAPWSWFHLTVFKPVSLRCLPLLKVKNLMLGSASTHEQVEYGDLLPTRENYVELARIIKTNQLKKFALNTFFHRGTNELTIQPFADALREQTSIEEFSITWSIDNIGGKENIKYLLLSGVALSSSIIKFSWADTWTGGDVDYVLPLIAEVFLKNNSIKDVYLCPRTIPNDLEAFNILGRSLQINNCLKKMDLNVSYSVEGGNASTPNALPGRSVGMSTTDLADFREGILKSSLTEIVFSFHNHSRQSPSELLVIKFIKEIKKVGLKVKLYHKDGVIKNSSYSYDEWEG